MEGQTNTQKIFNSFKKPHAIIKPKIRSKKLTQEDKENNPFKLILSDAAPKKDFNCRICKKTFAIMDNLKKHMAAHRETKEFKCHFCEKAFSKREELKKHLAIHGGLNCGICKKSFPNDDILKRHVLKSHDSNCQLCGERFEKVRSLKTHILTIHMGI